MRALLSLLLCGLFVVAGVFPPAPACAAPAPRVYNKPALLGALKDWESSLNERAMDDFERDLEREFILRLRFQVERRYTGDDASLVRILAFMLELEEQPQNLSLSYTTVYLRELLEAIRTIREPNENLARFIRQFTEASGIKNVMSADQFLRSRAYLNALETATAREVTDETWNELSARVTAMPDDEPPAALAAADAEAEAPELESLRLVGPGMPEPPPAPSADEAPESAIDPELLAELTTEGTGDIPTPAPALPPPAPRVQSIRSTDESAVLR